MRPAQKFSASTKRQLAVLFAQASSHAEHERILCVWLRASLGLSSPQIATVLGWHPGSVRNLQARVLREGIGVLEQPGRGGRHRAHLTLAEEEGLLADFCFAAGQGGVVEAGPLRVAYEKQGERTRSQKAPCTGSWPGMAGASSCLVPITRKRVPKHSRHSKKAPALGAC